MSLPNSMTVGKSYSDYVRGDYDWTLDDEKDPCEGCEDCGETQCDDCEDKKEYDKRNK